MPAFLATVEGDEGCVGDVYFEKHAINARRHVCDYWQDGELSGARVVRVPHLDQYEQQGWVPMIEMIYMGWWSECYNCHTKLTADEQYDDDDNEFIMDIDKIVGMFNGPSFCCQHCSDEFFGRRDAENGLKEKHRRELQALVVSRLGTDGIDFCDNRDKHFFDFSVKWDADIPWMEKATVRFDIPGTKYGAISVHRERKSRLGETSFHYSYRPDYEDVFIEFFKERTGRTLDKHNTNQ